MDNKQFIEEQRNALIKFDQSLVNYGIQNIDIETLTSFASSLYELARKMEDEVNSRYRIEMSDKLAKSTPIISSSSF